VYMKLKGKEEIINFVKNDENKALLVKIIDYIEYVEKYFEHRFTPFLDPSQVIKVEKIIRQYGTVGYYATGGIKDSERKIIVLYPQNMNQEDIELPITALCIEIGSKFEKIGHRDLLGSIMNLGIKREKIGDIIINDNKGYLIVYSDISYYIKLNLQRIKHSPVKVNYIDFSLIPPKEEKYREIVATVASLRLDSVIGAGFGESRSSISREIIAGNVKVNWEEVKDLSFAIKQGDVISLKGKGRIILSSVGNTTKKGRVNISIKRIL